MTMAKKQQTAEEAPEKKKTQQRRARVLTDEDRQNQYVSADVYALLSTEKGFPITYQAVMERIKSGNIELTKVDNIEGYFIDIKKNPFGPIQRGPKGPREK